MVSPSLYEETRGRLHNFIATYLEQRLEFAGMSTHHKGTEEERRALDVFIKLMRAATSVAERTGRPVAKQGLSPSHFGVLETLYHLGPLKVGQLADKHLKSHNNFTVVIDNMEKQGLVRRERDQEDRRVVMVHLTPEGRERIERVFPDFVRAVTQDLQVLTPWEQEQLSVLLRRLGKR
jgi:MarR family transcriptional regulator, 2-MHQ and catechol-resistance regulon repressor